MKKILLLIFQLLIFSGIFGQKVEISKTLPGGNIFPYHPEEIWRIFRYKSLKGDNEERLDSIYYFSWNSSDSGWYKTSCYVYHYDDNNNLLDYTRKTWDSSDSIWINNSRYLYLYNTDNTVDTYYSQSWNSGSGVWQNNSLYTYYYDIGVLIERIKKKWDSDIDDWIYDSFYTYTNNDNGLQIERTTQIWDTAISDWVNLTTYISTYDGSNNKIEYITQIWDTELQEWINNLQSLYTYNPDGIKIEDLNQQWNKDSSDWINSVQVIFVLDINNYYTEKIYKLWNSDLEDWETYVRYTYSNNNNGDPTAIEYQQWTGSRYISKTQYIYTYNDQGSLIEELSQQWNATDESWENGMKTDYYKTYFSGFRKKDNDLISCEFQNPYIPGYPIRCSSLLAGENYQVRLVDMNGIIIYNNIINGTDFIINGNFKDGVYLLIINKDNVLYFRKKIIIKNQY